MNAYKFSAEKQHNWKQLQWVGHGTGDVNF